MLAEKAMLWLCKKCRCKHFTTDKMLNLKQEKCDRAKGGKLNLF